jgi:hypothetical protein
MNPANVDLVSFLQGESDRIQEELNQIIDIRQKTEEQRGDWIDVMFERWRKENPEHE